MTHIPAVAEHIVRQSASMLDQISPEWWTSERVELGTLDIASGSRCLLAQSFGSVAASCLCCSSHSFSAGLDVVLELISDAGIADDDMDREDSGDRKDFAASHGFMGGYVTVDREIFPDGTNRRMFIDADMFTGPWVTVIRERRDAASEPINA